MKILAKLLTKILVVTIIGIAANNFATTAYALEEETTPVQETPILFVLDDCPHCEDLLEILDINDIMSIIDIDIKEVSDDENKADFKSRIEECDLSLAGVPTLYYQGNCYQGTFIAKDAVFSIAGLNNEEIESTASDTATITDTDHEAEVVSQEESSSVNQDGKSLADSLEASTQPVAEEIGFGTILIMLIAPTMFLSLAYLIIKKMKL